MHTLHKNTLIHRSTRYYCTGVELALLIGGGLASAGGTGLSMAANAGANKNMNAAVQGELDRQKKYQQTGQQVLEQNIQEQSPRKAESDIKAGQEQAMRHYEALNNAGAGGAVQPQAAAVSSTLKDSIVGGNAQARSNVLNQAAAGPQGLTEMDLMRAISDLKTKTKLAQNNAFSVQSEGVLPYEINAAQHSKDTQKGIGSLLQTAGLLASLGGMSLPAAAGGATTTPAQMTALGAGAGPLQAGAAGLPYNALTNMMTGIGALGGI